MNVAMFRLYTLRTHLGVQVRVFDAVCANERTTLLRSPVDCYKRKQMIQYIAIVRYQLAIKRSGPLAKPEVTKIKPPSRRYG